jgi:hypothetical protein
MEQYRNLGGNSSVAEYELAADAITVRFLDGAVYQYTEASVGRRNLELMKGHAAEGVGLNSFIMNHVRAGYAARLH